MTEGPQLVRGSFKHLIGVKELWANSAAYKYRIITIDRVKKKTPLGFNVQLGDGFGRNEGVFVSRVLFGSIFDVCKLLSVGDELIKIDDQIAKDLTINKIVRFFFDHLQFSITVKIMTPFARIQSRKRWNIDLESATAVSRQEDLKILNMKILPPKDGRHIYVEEEEETPPEGEKDAGETGESEADSGGGGGGGGDD